MGRWSRDELEEAFQIYQETALKAGTSGDWRPWADLFTEDATYIEHHCGTFGGREAIYNWIQSAMSQPVKSGDALFPDKAPAPQAALHRAASNLTGRRMIPG